MHKFLHSFYGRLSLILLLLIAVIGAGCISIAFYFSGHLFDEVEQQLNRDYAQKIALELQPLVEDEFSRERIENAIHYMMVLNPMVEIYLLDAQGKILIYFIQPAERIIKEQVDPAPIRQFIASAGQRFITGEDPRSPARRKPFSAAPLQMGPAPGYIYIILGGQAYDASLAAIRSGYYARAALVAFLLIMLITLVAGFLLFFLLTSRLRLLNRAITSFKQGEPFRPVNIRGRDELGSLGAAFNAMAASINTGVEQLKQAEKMRRELVANISHDLRSPLASIMGYVETILMKETELTPATKREYLEIILRNVAGIRKLVKELFEIVMLETKQIKPEKELFNLHELVHDIVLKFKNQAAEAQVKLSLDVPSALSLVEADIGMVERIITNLLENGLRFTPPGQALTIRLTEENRHVRVSIADTGRGIEPAELPHIFDRYYHGKKNQEPHTGKTGLGLAIAKEMVELHGGTLQVESTLNQGSRFYFDLPV